MNVLLLGATGFSGKEVLKELLRKNYTVTAITRDSSSVKTRHSNLTILEGDVLDEVFVGNALTGKDAVINCLGIGGKGNAKPNALVSNATKVVVNQMERSATKRLICMSNVGAGDSIKYQPWIFTQLILPYFMKWLQVIIDDKNIMEPAVAKSKLDWTILRFPNIVDKPGKGKVSATLDGKGLKMSITNEDLAVFMVQQLESDQFLHQSPSVSN